MGKEKKRHSQWLLIEAAKPLLLDPGCRCPEKHGQAVPSSSMKPLASDLAASPPCPSPYRDSLGLSLCRPMSCLECFFLSFSFGFQGSPNLVFCPRSRVQYSVPALGPGTSHMATDSAWPVLGNTLTHTSSSLQRIWPN